MTTSHVLPAENDDPDAWWACTQPERPYDDHCCYWEPCPWCMGKVRLDASRDPKVAEGLRDHMATHGDRCAMTRQPPTGVPSTVVVQVTHDGTAPQ